MSSHLPALRFVFDGILIPMVCLFGLMGNLTSLFLLNSPKIDMKVSFRHILMMLSIFDAFFVIGVIFAYSIPELSPFWKDSLHSFVFPRLFPFIQIALTGSIWSTVSVAVERYLSVVYSRTRLSNLPSKVYIIPVVSISLIWNVTRFFELKTCTEAISLGVPTNMSEEEVNASSQVYAMVANLGNVSRLYGIFNESLLLNETVNMDEVDENLGTFYTVASDNYTDMVYKNVSILCATDLRKSSGYIRNYILLANFLAMNLLPFTLLAVLNSLLYRFITRAGVVVNHTSARQKRDQSIAMILVLIVVVFACCNTLKIIVTMYEVVQMVMSGDVSDDWPEWCEVLTLLSHFLLVFNSSFNIIIYSWKDAKFRSLLMEKLSVVLCRMRKPGGVMVGTTVVMTNLHQNNTNNNVSVVTPHVVARVTKHHQQTEV